LPTKHASREINLTFFRTRPKAPELAVFSRQLATMISSGMSFLRALYVLEEQTESKSAVKETIVAVRKDVEAGSVAERRDGAPPERCSGTLFIRDERRRARREACFEGSLLRVADQLEKDASLRRQIKSAMVYPDPGGRRRGRDHARAVRLS